MAQEDLDRIGKAGSDLTRERDQIIKLVTDQQTNLATDAQQIQDLIASGADNAAIVDAVKNTLLPTVEDTVTQLDQFTPEGTPTFKTK